VTNIIQAFTFSIFTELVVEERKYLLPMLSVIHCPTVPEEILQTIVDIQINILYHITPLKSFFAGHTLYITSNTTGNKQCVYRLYDWFDLFITRSEMEIQAMLLGSHMGPQ